MIRQNLAAAPPQSLVTMPPSHAEEVIVKTELKALSGSVTGKVLFVAFLILTLLIPLGMIEGLVDERASLYGTARDDIGHSWGHAQTIGGPILVVPFAHTRYVNGQAAPL